MRAVIASRRSAGHAFLDIATKRRRWQVANFCFMAFLALALIGTAPFQEWTMSVQSSGGDTVNQVLHLSIFLLLLFGSGTLITKRQLLPLPLSITLLLAYCLITVLWAVDPVISLRRLILTAMVIWVIFRCVGDLGYARTVRIVEYALIVLLVVNYVLVFLTSYGVHPDMLGEDSNVVGNWRGILPHKNVAGATCAFTIIFLLFDGRRLARYIAVPAILAALIFLYFTQSKTSEVVLVIAVVSGWLIRPYHTDYRSFVGVLLVIIAVLGLQLLSTYWTPLKDVFNDPTALTGRASIWPLLIDYASEHLWTGAGFGSFWQIGDNGPIWTLTNGWVAQYASHGHNGYLDLLVTIGLPGLILAIVVLLGWPLARLVLSQSMSKSQRSLLLALFIFCVCHNLTESTLMNGASTVQIFFVMTLALIFHLSNAGIGAHKGGRAHALRAPRVRTPLRLALTRRASLAMPRGGSVPEQSNGQLPCSS